MTNIETVLSVLADKLQSQECIIEMYRKENAELKETIEELKKKIENLNF